VVTSWA